MELFNQYVEFFSGTSLYEDVFSNFPSPLNNPTFISVISLLLAAYIVFQGVGLIRGAIFKSQIQTRKHKEQLARLEQEKADREYRQQRLEEERAFREEYSNLLKLAISRNIDTSSFTFEQYKAAKDRVQQEPQQLVITQDNSEEIEKLRREAYYDAGTNVPNKKAYQLAFENMTAGNLSAISFDVNYLKKTNDNFGHSAGDKLLSSVANLLSDLFGMDDFEQGGIYRTGGDEFYALLPGIGEKIISKKLKSLDNSLAELTKEDEDGIIYSVSYGYCVGKPTMTKKEIVEQADKNMYEMKEILHQKLNAEAEPKTEEITEEVDTKPIETIQKPEIIEEPIETFEETKEDNKSNAMNLIASIFSSKKEEVEEEDYEPQSFTDGFEDENQKNNDIDIDAYRVQELSVEEDETQEVIETSDINDRINSILSSKEEEHSNEDQGSNNLELLLREMTNKKEQEKQLTEALNERNEIIKRNTQIEAASRNKVTSEETQKSTKTSDTKVNKELEEAKKRALKEKEKNNRNKKK